jgi:hypothetical protein
MRSPAQERTTVERATSAATAVQVGSLGTAAYHRHERRRRRRYRFRVSRAALFALASALCVACAAGGTATSAPRPDLYVLTAANELVGATSGGRIVVQRQLARARRGTSPSARLALDGGRLFVLARRDAPPDRLVVVEAATARGLASRTLPADLRARVVVAASGRVFVAGNRPVRRVAGSLFEEDADVLEVDRDGNALRRFTVREARGSDWWVTSAAVSPDGARLAVSYHGGCTPETAQLCTGGADLFDVTRGAREPCVEPYPRSGCIDAHGHVDFFGDALVAATGSGEIRLAKRTIDSRLGNSHVMDFALDRPRGELVAAGPCQHLGGLSVLDLESGQARLLVRPGPLLQPGAVRRNVCGTRVALMPGLIAVAPIGTAVAATCCAGRVLLVDRGTGRVRARVRLRAEPVDVLAVRRAR